MITMRILFSHLYMYSQQTLFLSRLFLCFSSLRFLFRFYINSWNTSGNNCMISPPTRFCLEAPLHHPSSLYVLMHDGIDRRAGLFWRLLVGKDLVIVACFRLNTRSSCQRCYVRTIRSSLATRLTPQCFLRYLYHNLSYITKSLIHSTTTIATSIIMKSDNMLVYFSTYVWWLSITTLSLCG